MFNPTHVDQSKVTGSSFWALFGTLGLTAVFSQSNRSLQNITGGSQNENKLSKNNMNKKCKENVNSVSQNGQRTKEAGKKLIALSRRTDRR